MKIKPIRKGKPMLKKEIRIYVIPTKPTARITNPPDKKRGPDLSGLKRYAEELCRDILSRLSSLDSNGIRKVTSVGKGAHS